MTAHDVAAYPRGVGHGARTQVGIVYLSPRHAGRSTATLASWYVDDIEKVVDELAAKGVTFEQYDQPPVVTDVKGIATFDGDAKVAYFKDPDGNTLSIAQPPRS